MLGGTDGLVDFISQHELDVSSLMETITSRFDDDWSNERLDSDPRLFTSDGLQPGVKHHLCASGYASGTLKLIAQEVETEQIDGAGFAWIGVPLRMRSTSCWNARNTLLNGKGFGRLVFPLAQKWPQSWVLRTNELWHESYMR